MFLFLKQAYSQGSLILTKKRTRDIKVRFFVNLNFAMLEILIKVFVIQY